MASLDSVVNGMSKEMNTSTLGWDVVVNYKAQDLNKVLKAAYDAESEGRLSDLSLHLKYEDLITGVEYGIDYKFQLGSPLIEFEAVPMMTSSCQLEIPIIGGTVVIEGKTQSVPDGRYALHLSGIALASVNGTKGASRDPKASDQSFVFSSPDTTGTVSLDINTSASANRLAVEFIIHDDIGAKVPAIDAEAADLEKAILAYFKANGSSIFWDLAHVTNHVPSGGSTVLVPKEFRFACYAPDTTQNGYTILSIFIHLSDTIQSGTQEKLQEKWSIQWAEPDNQFLSSYGVPPIPDTYTASIIFNHQLIADLVEKNVQQQGMKIEQIQKTSSDKFAIKWKIHTGKVYERSRYQRIDSGYPYSEFEVDGASVNLDSLSEPEGLLYLSIGQNGGINAGASLQWKFSYKAGYVWVNGRNGVPYDGTIVATYILDKTTDFDNRVLPDYQVHLSIHLSKNDWGQTFTTDNDKYYDLIFSSHFDSAARHSLPDPPPFDLDLLDIDFFMTTNLLLPSSKVINFEASPGVRFPRDLYLVGHIIDSDQVKRLRSAVVE